VIFGGRLFACNPHHSDHRHHDLLLTRIQQLPMMMPTRVGNFFFCAMRCTPSAFLVPLFNNAASAAWSKTLEQSVAYFALPSRKTFAATAVYSCCYKNSSLNCRAAGCEGWSAVAGANFSLLLLRSYVFYTCDNSFPNSISNRDK
jgi:hypothetical protein